VSQIYWLFFGFSGRIARAPYLLAALFMMVILTFLLYRLMLAQEAGRPTEAWDVALSLAMLASLWTQAALGAKRFHDFGKPGLAAIALFIPILNAIGFIALCIIPGDRGPNAYGERTNAPA
jgi:uncharacterized membrane protein YhaH (DUF805 family)